MLASKYTLEKYYLLNFIEELVKILFRKGKEKIYKL